MGSLFALAFIPFSSGSSQFFDPSFFNPIDNGFHANKLGQVFLDGWSTSFDDFGPEFPFARHIEVIGILR